MKVYFCFQGILETRKTQYTLCAVLGPCCKNLLKCLFFILCPSWITLPSALHNIGFMFIYFTLLYLIIRFILFRYRIRRASIFSRREIVTTLHWRFFSTSGKENGCFFRMKYIIDNLIKAVLNGRNSNKFDICDKGS